MKNRKRKPVLNKRAKNTLRIDPTRTGLLRRRFVAELKRRFSRIKVAILKLVVDEDAFGLKERSRDPFALNAFCPTGEGGGVDPTCSPGSTGAPAPAYVQGSGKGTLYRQCSGCGEPSSEVSDAAYQARSEHLVRVYGPNRNGWKDGFPKDQGHDDADFDTLAKLAYDITRGSTPNTRALDPAWSEEDKMFTLWEGSSTRDSLTIFPGKRNGVAGYKIESDSTTFVPKGASLEEMALAIHRAIRVRPPTGLKERAEKKLTSNRWRFDTNPEKLRQFKEWLRAQFNATLRGKSDEELWAAYIEAGFRKGAGRAFDDTNRRTRWQRRDFYEGTRSQFLRTAFGQPESVDKVKLLASRSFDDLENVTADMATKMTRALTDGLVQGKGPREIARDLNAQTDMGQERALTIARTEIIRAHAEGQLTALEDLGVEEVGVTVEWMITDDEALCPKCAAMQGVILKLSEAHGLIPAHPNCRCAFAPYVGIGGDKVKDTKSSIDKAITRARDVSGDDEFGPESVSRERPRSILDDEGRELRVLSRFLGDHE
jgi:SPP1 gp7 family putative phage head morphogenesis protein